MDVAEIPRIKLTQEKMCKSDIIVDFLQTGVYQTLFLAKNVMLSTQTPI
jgi:hypothetical protein